jgi:hypothetical protein
VRGNASYPVLQIDRQPVECHSVSLRFF